MFWPFHLIRDDAHMSDAGSSLMTGKRTSLLEIGDKLQQLQAPLPIIFSRDDSLSGNLPDDGNRLWLIDVASGDGASRGLVG